MNTTYAIAAAKCTTKWKAITWYKKNLNKCENKFSCVYMKYETRYFIVLALYAKILKFDASVYDNNNNTYPIL